MPKNLFDGEPGFEHGETPAIGVLLAFLGTPEAPTAAAVRPYLRQFLSDPRVIEYSRPLWWLILNLFVLPFRPRKSAELYAKIWTDEGSPLLVISRRQQRAIEERLRAELGTPTHVALGATYGRPSMREALESLRERGCRRLLFFPLFSHYSSTSTGAAFDALTEVLREWRWVPELRTIFSYHDEPAYVEALARSIRERWDADGEPDKLVMSFHGIPQRYLENGDPYHCQCLKTGRLVAERLELPPDRWVVSFQSLFGREEWIKPYTDVTLKALAKTGVEHVDVVCPGFAADCLETLEEIEEQNREFFLGAGGREFRYVPALNDRPDHIELLVGLIRRNLHGWAVPAEEWDAEAAAAAAAASRHRAVALRRDPATADAGVGGG